MKDAPERSIALPHGETHAPVLRSTSDTAAVEKRRRLRSSSGVPRAPSTPPRASVVITTRDRKDDLRNAIRSCLEQTVPVEVLVIDDGSTDGTSEMVRREFPQVLLDRIEQPLGPAVQRNRGVRMAAAPIVFSIDDDAVFTSRRIVGQTLQEFDHPRVAAVSIPYIDVNKPPTPLVSAPHDGKVYVVYCFGGGASALRKDVFTSLGGYREFLFRQAEEMEFCARLYRAGYVVRRGRADTIHHFESPRGRKLVYFQMARNTLLYAWYNVPTPLLLPHWIANHFNMLRFVSRRGHPIWVLQGVWAGWKSIWHQRGRRHPMPVGVYRVIRRLIRRRIVLLDEIERLLPEPRVPCGSTRPDA